MYYEGFNGLPVNYDWKNQYNAKRNPSELHAHDTGLAAYFRRYLIQKIFSVFDFEGIPETWAKDYFFYTLFLWGNIAIIDTDKYGVICQHCGLSGYDVFYRPTTAIISNPLIEPAELRIGTECALVKMQPDYGGAYDICNYYADQLALCAEGLATNLVNTKLAFVFAAGSKSAAQSLKKLYDKIASGSPAVFADKKLWGDDGRPMWDTFSQNLQQNYIAGDILTDMAQIDNRFEMTVGISNTNLSKASGVSDAEVHANDEGTKSLALLWLDTIREGLDVANRLFGLNMSVNLRFDTPEGGDPDDQGSMDTADDDDDR